jgi:hypothetical protein
MAIGLGAIFLPIHWLLASWAVNVTLYILFMIGYCGLLFLFRVITLEEIRWALQALKNRRSQFAVRGESF